MSIAVANTNPASAVIASIVEPSTRRMHRHTAPGGKHPGERFHAGTLAEGMRAAITEVRRGYREMIEAWRR